jgi:hypothetical protein
LDKFWSYYTGKNSIKYMKKRSQPWQKENKNQKAKFNKHNPVTKQDGVNYTP